MRLVLDQPVGIPAPVPMLVVLQGYGRGGAHDATRRTLENGVADDGVGLDDGEFLVGQLAGLEEDGIGNADLAHVVHGRGHAQQMRPLFREPGLERQQKRVFRHALDVMRRLLGAGLHHLAQGQHHLALRGHDLLGQEEVAQGHGDVAAQDVQQSALRLAQDTAKGNVEEKVLVRVRVEEPGRELLVQHQHRALPDRAPVEVAQAGKEHGVRVCAQAPGLQHLEPLVHAQGHEAVFLAGRPGASPGAQDVLQGQDKEIRHRAGREQGR